MAMWDLNCQSNPSSADDKELAPYLARQKAMREFFERALFAPKDQGNNGLYFLGATTGSGKNYTAEQVTADLIAGGWDDSGCFNKCPGRRYLVFVVPGKDNRDNYVASANCWLNRAWMAMPRSAWCSIFRVRAITSCIGLRLRAVRAPWACATFRVPSRRTTRALIASLSERGATRWRSPMTFWASLTLEIVWEVLQTV